MADPVKIVEDWAQVPADAEARIKRGDGLPDGFCVTWGYETAMEEGYTPDEVLSLIWDGACVTEKHAMADEARWFCVSSDDWKSHAVPAVLVDGLIADMHTRGHKGEIARKPIVKWGIDRGGMCRMNRPSEDFLVGGLRLGMPSEHVRHFRERLEALTPRRFGRRTYFKLHCHWNCLMLTPVLRWRLIDALLRREDRAESRADAFYADKERPHG